MLAGSMALSPDSSDALGEGVSDREGMQHTGVCVMCFFPSLSSIWFWKEVDSEISINTIFPFLYLFILLLV